MPEIRKSADLRNNIEAKYRYLRLNMAIMSFAVLSALSLHAQENTAYDFQKNAERLYARAEQSAEYPGIADKPSYSEKITLRGRNVFLVYGVHFHPEHIRNMAKIFAQEKIFEQPDKWLFLIEGVTRSAIKESAYSEIEYAAQSADAWKIPALNIIPYYNDDEIIVELIRWALAEPKKGAGLYALEAETAICYLLMFGMLNGDIPYTAGHGYDRAKIERLLNRYIILCQQNNIPFDRAKFNTLLPLNDSKRYNIVAELYWDQHMYIRNRISKENLDKVLERYSAVQNILVYCGGDHRIVF